MKKLLVRSRLLAVVATSGLILAAALMFVAKAAENCDIDWGSAQYRGAVTDCQTSATVGLTKAGFGNIQSGVHTNHTSIWGFHGNYRALVLCTKAENGGATYAEMVIGPTGNELDSLFKAVDTDFK